MRAIVAVSIKCIYLAIEDNVLLNVPHLNVYFEHCKHCYGNSKFMCKRYFHDKNCRHRSRHDDVGSSISTVSLVTYVKRPLPSSTIVLSFKIFVDSCKIHIVLTRTLLYPHSVELRAV